MRLIGMLLILGLLLTAFTTSASANTVTAEQILSAVSDGLDYISRLTRYAGSLPIVREYPALPVVATAWHLLYGQIYFIPGLDQSYGIIKTWVEVSLVDEAYVLGTGIMCDIVQRMDFKLYDPLISLFPVTAMTVFVSETRVATASTEKTQISINVAYVAEDSVLTIDRGFVISPLSNFKIFLVGAEIDAYPGLTYTLTFNSVKATFPSMRFTIRHVNALVPPTLAAAGATSSATIAIDNWVRYIQSAVIPLGNGSLTYDIYATAVPIESSQTKVYPNLTDNFYDAIYWGGVLGYDNIYSFFDSQGTIKRAYPAYPYKSKIVTAVELYSIVTLVTGDLLPVPPHGGLLFLTALQLLDDPLYYEYMALYYIQQENYEQAANMFINYVASRWDGIGIPVTQQNGYSTMRTALALAIGSKLYRKGYFTNRALLDQMASTISQLQWKYWGYYSPDGGSTVKILVKPDHYGGFVVSYGKIQSYGFLPFRPSLLDSIFNIPGMDPEYAGPLPTNAEATLMCINALLSYLYYVLWQSSGYEICDDIACPVLIDDEIL